MDKEKLVSEALQEWNKMQKRVNKRKEKHENVNSDVSSDISPTSADNSDFTKRRSRAFALITYIDSNALEKFLKMSPWVRNWCYCTHDRDVKPDKTPKEKHTHVLLYTYESKTSSAVKKLFDRYSESLYYGTGMEAQNTTCQVCFDMVSQYRYLLHLDDKDKYQYEPCCRIVDGLAYWSDLEKTAGMTGADCNKALSMFDDLKSGIGMRDFIVRYGRDGVFLYSRLKDVLIRDEFEQICDKQDIKSLVWLMLENSEFSKENIEQFWYMFDFLQHETKKQYMCKLDFDMK